MASEEVFKQFKDQSTFELEGASISVAEANKINVTVVGIFDDLVNMGLNPGDRVPAQVKTKMGRGALYVENFSIQHTDGDMGSMVISCVEVDSPTDPYAQTVTIDMSAVSKKLINHPLMKDKETQLQIRMWEQTEATRQFDEKGKPQSLFVFSGDKSIIGTPLDYPSKLTNKDAIKYAKAVLRGVDTYEVYLPVITRVSSYLKIPGTKIDHTTHEITGEVSPKGASDIGTFDIPPITLEGFNEDGKWFKNQDQWQQQANGTWIRTEQWTYTNDLRFTWIYKDGITKELVKEDEEDEDK